MPKHPDLVGKIFGRLFVRKLVGSARGKRWWDVVCACGNERFYSTTDLAHNLSCGCGQREAAAKICRSRGTHHMRGSRLYTIWRGMRQRCTLKNSTNYHCYGGRGIKICHEWRTFSGFYDWAKSSGYSDVLSIDRIDVNGHYEPKNCRWSTPKQQAANRRPRRAA